MSHTLRFAALLGPDGIERDRAVEIDDAGVVVAVSGGAAPFDGFLALPGMPNAHSHVFQRALMGRGEVARGADSFWTWREEMYRVANLMDAADVYSVARQAFKEMLAGGFTHLVEFHYLQHGVDGGRGLEMTEAVVRAAAEAGLPLTLLPVYYRTAGFDGALALPEQHRFVHRTVDEFLRMLEGLVGVGGVSGGVGGVLGGVAPHSLRAAPVMELAELVAGVDALLGSDVPLHIHVSEQAGEVEECLERFGTTPIDLLFDHVDAGPRWNLVHATHATAEELRAIRTAGASVVLCPLTEAYLGDGTFEAREHLLEQGNASVGTDANVRISAIEELRTLEYGQRLRDRMRARLGTSAGLGAPLWGWLAAGGARAAAAPIGRIEVGRRADFVVLDGDSATFAGHSPETAVDAWLVGGGSDDIAAVYVGGRKVVDHGIGENDDDVHAAFTRTMRALNDR